MLLSIKDTVCCPELCGRLEIVQTYGHLVTTLHCKNIVVGKHSGGDKVSFLSCEGLDNGQTMMDFMVMDSFDFLALPRISIRLLLNIAYSLLS